MSTLPTTSLGSAGGAIEAEEARKVIARLRGLLQETWDKCWARSDGDGLGFDLNYRIEVALYETRDSAPKVTP